MNDETKNTDKAHANVSFGGGSAIAVTGIIGGVVLALGFPLVVLAFGQSLGSTLLVVFVISGLVVGGLIALTSAFFGLVMPREVGGGAPSDWMREIKSMAKEWREWENVDWKNWNEKDWMEWAEKKKRAKE